MALDFKFPDVGEGIHEGKLVKWLVKEGDEVKEDAVLAEVETDKAVVEIPSPRKGFVLKRHFNEMDVIRVGQTLVTIGEQGEPIPVEEARAQPSPMAQKIFSPQIATAQKTSAQPPTMPTAPTQSFGIMATPSIRQRARELGIDINLLKGSGPGGRIMSEDVERAAKERGSGGVAGGRGDAGVSAGGMEAQKSAAPALQTDFSQFGEIEKVKIAGLRKRIAEVMARSKRTAAHVTHFDEADVTALSAAREELKKQGEQKGVKVTYLPFIVKAIVAALKMHPKFNSSFDEANDEIILKKYYNLGIAVDTEDGLIVPVLRDADKMDLLGISAEIMRLAQEAKEKKMKLEDLRGGSFTITNIGSIGGEFFTPIIYHPEAAILGLGRISEKVIVEEGKAVISKRLPLSLSFDHRVIDGAEAARFVNDVVKLLENPGELLK